jgi:hypothetical protein
MDFSIRCIRILANDNFIGVAGNWYYLGTDAKFELQERPQSLAEAVGEQG